MPFGNFGGLGVQPLDGIGQAIEAATLPYYHPGQGLGGRYDANPFAPPLPLVPIRRRRG